MLLRIIILVLLLVAAQGQAAVPQSISVQGYLTDRIGSPIEEAQSVTFAIYTAPVGGVPVWQETMPVAFFNGLFSVTLGRVAAFPPDLFDVPLWLGTTVATDNEMEPRRPLTTVGFSFRAEDSDALQGRSAAELDQTYHVTDIDNPHAVTAAQTGAAETIDIENLQAQIDAALVSISVLQTDLAAAKTTIVLLQTNLANETAARIVADDAELAARIAAIDAEVAARLATDSTHKAAIIDIQANTVLSLDGVLSRPDNETALFTGVNVQVVNGTGATEGDPNGTGNVIVGYNLEDTDSPICSLGDYFHLQTICESNGGVWATSHKTGSHNVIIGDRHNYSRFSGLVVGLNSNITGEWSSVSGGINNSARGSAASVSGGNTNFAGGYASSVSGGQYNSAGLFCYLGIDCGSFSSIVGGSYNSTFADYSAILGGTNNQVDSFGLGLSIVGGSNINCIDAPLPTTGGWACGVFYGTLYGTFQEF